MSTKLDTHYSSASLRLTFERELRHGSKLKSCHDSAAYCPRDPIKINTDVKN